MRMLICYNKEINGSTLLVLTLTTVAPQSRRKSAGAGLGLTRHLTSYPSSSARLTTCLPKVPVPPITMMLVGLTGVPGAKLAAATGSVPAAHVINGFTDPLTPTPKIFQHNNSF